MLVNKVPEIYQNDADYQDEERFHWMIVRTLPGEEKKLQRLLEKKIHGQKARNILEVYNPVRSTIKETDASKSLVIPLFAGHLFVLATQRALTSFLVENYPNGRVLYDRRVSATERAKVWIVPEAQMKFFRDFNENYADKVIVLERPYSDYAFNPKTNQPNALVKVLDGPLAGKIGYLARFKGNRRLVFQMQSPYSKDPLAVAIPDIWNFHCVLVHNAENDVQTLQTKKARAVDMLLGIIQGTGGGEDSLRIFHQIMGILTEKPSLVHLCQQLSKPHLALSQALAKLTPTEAELILYLVRYEQENPGYVKQTWRRLILRPFLTPTGIYGVDNESILHHPAFTEYILPQTFQEPTFYPTENEERVVTVTYYAHIGVIHKRKSGNRYTLFCNWDAFLAPYYLTADHAQKVLVRGTKRPDLEALARGESPYGKQENEAAKLRESFRNFAPTLYQVFNDEQSLVRPQRQMRIGSRSLHVLAVSVKAESEEEAMQSQECATLIATSLQICREVSTSTHLAIWRRYLMGVWLHE